MHDISLQLSTFSLHGCLKDSQISSSRWRWEWGQKWTQPFAVMELAAQRRNRCNSAIAMISAPMSQWTIRTICILASREKYFPLYPGRRPRNVIYWIPADINILDCSDRYWYESVWLTVLFYLQANGNFGIRFWSWYNWNFQLKPKLDKNI